jgi:N-acylneuraminate cytidylyltransferase
MGKTKKECVIALLTGRGNNTLTDKNIYPVLGKPLLQYTAQAARKSRYIEGFFVSSDCTKILDAAANCGYKKIVRPSELALPQSQHVDVLKHALTEIRRSGVEPSILMVQLANVGTIKTEWIDEAIVKLSEDKNASAAVLVHEDMDHHPYRAKRIDEDGSLKSFFNFRGKKISSNRQDLPPSYYLDHSIWVLRVKKSLDAKKTGEPPWGFMGSKVLPIITKGCFDVHDRVDIEKTEKWLIENNLVSGISQ